MARLLSIISAQAPLRAHGDDRESPLGDKDNERRSSRFTDSSSTARVGGIHAEDGREKEKRRRPRRLWPRCYIRYVEDI